MAIKQYNWETVYQPSSHVVARKIADETILVPISGNLANMQRLFTVNEVGASIWNLMDGKRNVKEIRQLLLDEFNVKADQLDADIWDFIDRLKTSDLILEQKLNAL